MYYPRALEEVITRFAESFPGVVVYGSRQVGKSTLLRHLYPKLSYVTLDDLQAKQLANENPRLFLQANPWPVIIDEIQKAPGLLPEIKISIDEQRLEWLRNGQERKLMYLLTGSSQFEMQEAVTESLAGRVGELKLAPFSQVEAAKAESHPFNPDIATLQQVQARFDGKPKTRLQVFEDIFSGGMPDIVTGVARREDYFPSYVSTYLEKDVRNLITASNEATFLRFLSYVAMRTAQLVNYEDIAGAVGIDGKTCRRWLSILESSGIIFYLRPYFPNLSTRIIKAPKLYFSDTGLCAYLCGWPDAQMLERGAMAGAFYETYVVGEVVKSIRNVGADPAGSVFYYRDKDNREIDLLIVREGKLYPVEIKKGVNPVKPTKNFRVLEKYKMPVMPGVVIDSTDRLHPINENAWACPVWLIGL